MKQLKTVWVFLFLMFSGVLMAQLTPEQKKQMEDAQKKAAEAQKKVEEMMNNPEMKKMMEQLKKQDSLYEAERKKKQKAQKNKHAKKDNKAASDYYWHNTIESSTQGKFNGWSFGDAALKLGLFDRSKRAYAYIKIGNISSNGQVTILLPAINLTALPSFEVTKGFSEGDDLFHNYNKTLSYSNSSVKYLASRFNLRVMQGEKDLGSLSVANSVITRGNLDAPCCSNKAGDGYIAYWVYMSEANTIKGKDNPRNQAVDVNLDFKKGWNIVLTRVEGNKANSWMNKFHTATTVMPADAKYYFNSPLLAKN